MASSTLDTAGNKVELNSTRLLLSAMLLVVIGMAVFIVQPGFVQGLVEYAGFDDKQAGYIASAEMFGIALATIIMTVLAAMVINPGDYSNVNLLSMTLFALSLACILPPVLARPVMAERE